MTPTSKVVGQDYLGFGHEGKFDKFVCKGENVQCAQIRGLMYQKGKPLVASSGLEIPVDAGMEFMLSVVAGRRLRRLDQTKYKTRFSSVAVVQLPGAKNAISNQPRKLTLHSHVSLEQILNGKSGVEKFPKIKSPNLELKDEL